MVSEDPKSARALVASDVAGRRSTVYPEPFKGRVDGRTKRALGDAFGLVNFGVNLTTLAPGSQSALKHRHSVQDEFVYILAGELVLVCDAEETVLRTGMCAGFRAGATAHHLINRSSEDAAYLEVGDRLAGDRADYPDDDLAATWTDAGWRFTRKTGEPY